MLGKITKIEIQKKNKDRVNVYVDNEFGFACSASIIYLQQLKIGEEVDTEKLSKIISEDNYIKAKKYVLKVIEKTYKTEKQIFDKMILKEYDEKVISRVIQFLREYKFVDDNKYAQMYINDKIKEVGRNKIKYTLLKRGIDEKIIIQKLSNIDKKEEEESILKLAKKKYKLLIETQNDKKNIYIKLGKFLVGKGYDYDMVKSTLNKVIDKEDIDNNNNNKSNDIEKIYDLAEKRYNIIIKSENNEMKVRRRLGDYLLRRGYSFEIVKKILNKIIKLKTKE